jgi:hypothetical protein
VKLTIPEGPLAMWHAAAAAQQAILFADAWPNRKGRGRSVFYLVGAAEYLTEIEVWRTAGGEIRAVAVAAEPLGRIHV